MKKIISVFLALCFSAAVMCSCNNQPNTENIPSSPISETESLNDGEQSENISAENSASDTKTSDDSNSQVSAESSASKTPVSDNQPESSQNSSKPNSNQNSAPNSNPNDNQNNTPNSNPNDNQNSATSSNPNDNQNSAPSGNPNDNQNSAPSGNPNDNQNSAPSGNPNDNQNSAPSGNPNDNQNSAPSGNPMSNAQQEALYNALFDINSKISIRIDISNAELLKLQQDYDKYKNKGSKSPIYRIASKVIFTINGKDYEIDDVGVRLKGNTSRTDFYNSSNGMYNMINLRLSFDETFDDKSRYGSQVLKWNAADREARKKRTFATLNGLEIKWNKNYDQTYIREYYTSLMYRENGILCAKNNISQINISGNNMGVYFIYEPVDNNFIERNLPQKDWDGDLYKVGWTNNPADYTMNVSYGIEDEDKSRFYNFDLKTNKKKSNHSQLKNLLSVINKPNLTQAEFEKVVDKDYWIKFTALSYFIGNPDDMRNNYNNHYIYFLKSSGKAIFIPYDNDRTFGITQDYNPTGDAMTGVSPFSSRAEGNYSNQRNPLYTKTILNNGFYVEQYKSELNRIANSKWLTANNFNPIYETAKANYSDMTTPSKNYNNADESKLSFTLNGSSSGSGSNMAVESYFKKILQTYNKYK